MGLQEHFGTIPDSMWSLLLDGVLLDSVGVRVRLMIEDGNVPATICFLLFVMLSSTTVMNMLIGVLCEVVSAVNKAEKENAAIKEMKGSLLSLLKKLDVDGSGDTKWAP